MDKNNNREWFNANKERYQRVLKICLAKRVAEDMRQTKPFIDYINRAVDCVNEEM